MFLLLNEIISHINHHKTYLLTKYLFKCFLFKIIVNISYFKNFQIYLIIYISFKVYNKCLIKKNILFDYLSYSNYVNCLK